MNGWIDRMFFLWMFQESSSLSICH